MIKRLTATALPLLLSAQLVSAASEYTVNDVSLDGNTWTDETTSILAGQTYALGIDLSFESGVGGPDYTPAQAMSLNLSTSDGALLGSASAVVPSSVTEGNLFGVPFVDAASWQLQGSLTFDESFGAPGVYNVAFSSAGLGQGGFNQNLTVQAAPPASNPVPAPGTLASLALGLLGLTFLRRRMNRR